MNSLEMVFFPLTAPGEGFFKFCYKNGRVGKVTSRVILNESAVQFLVKYIFSKNSEINCIEVTSPSLGYTAVFPRR
jgi:hypothetical protein